MLKGRNTYQHMVRALQKSIWGPAGVRNMSLLQSQVASRTAVGCQQTEGNDSSLLLRTAEAMPDELCIPQYEGDEALLK